MLLANRVAGAARFVGAPAPHRHSLRTQNGSVTCMAASRPMWLPGEPHLRPTPSSLTHRTAGLAQPSVCIWHRSSMACLRVPLSSGPSH